MFGFNKVIIAGRLGKNPKKGTTREGNSYVQLHLATHRRVVGHTEAPSKKVTDWHCVFVWGKQAEACERFLKKGEVVLVEGVLSHYEQEDSGGTKRRQTSIHARQVSFLGQSKTDET
mgnify:CR=1 FL=1